MEPWFGVNRWWYGETVTYKEVAFGNFNPHSNASRQPEHSNLNTEVTYKNKRKKDIKKVLDLCKLTLFCIRDRTNNFTLFRANVIIY